LTTQSIADAVWRFDATYEWASIALGAPRADAAAWVAFGRFYDPVVAGTLTRRVQAGEDFCNDPLTLIGNYVFRDLCYLPLMLAGYLFAAERRVPVLRDNLLVRDSGSIDQHRLLTPRAVALADDPLAGQLHTETAPSYEALTDRLFAEVLRLCEPLIASFRAHKFVAPANAWGSILDFLCDGFLHAGEHGLGMDTAWAAWEQAIAGRDFPVRRRPRRQQFTIDGQPVELPVKAGCCLWYTSAEAKVGDERYCTTCYLETDARRIERLIRYRQEEAEQAALSVATA
jgi:hypothetical protein